MPAVLALAVLAFTTLSVRAEDFWVKTDWKNWSKDDCMKMLYNSPWTFQWQQPIIIGDASSTQPESMTSMRATHAARDPSVHYYIQDRSSVPVREAYIRYLQIANKYNKMDDAHKKAFDAQAETILDRTFDEVILIHVDYTGPSPYQNELMEYWNHISEDKIKNNIFLINQRGDYIPPFRFDRLNPADRAFEIYFPRTKNNEPIIQEADKMFTVEFPSPSIVAQLTTSLNDPPAPRIPGGVGVVAEFKLEKMVWKGKRSY
ncbi:MAG: hypothetical protein WAM91_04670 [Candidatus Acidiferrales bacterium]